MLTVSCCSLPSLCFSLVPRGYLYPYGNCVTFRWLIMLSALLFIFSALPFSFGQYIDTIYTVGLGEPVNAILSGKSDPEILIDQEADGGLRNYFLYVRSHRSFVPPGSVLLWADRRVLCVR